MAGFDCSFSDCKIFNTEQTLQEAKSVCCFHRFILDTNSLTPVGENRAKDPTVFNLLTSNEYHLKKMSFNPSSSNEHSGLEEILDLQRQGRRLSDMQMRSLNSYVQRAVFQTFPKYYG